MREIKFRAWDGQKIVTDFDLEGATGIPVANESQTDSRKLELMQFTGLIDKNGVEIYEGDIVKSKGFVIREVQKRDKYSGDSWTEPMEMDKEDVCEVTWGFAGFHLSRWNYATEPEYEVIGNIYENPDLLTTPT